MGLEYSAHTIRISKGERFTLKFMAVNPNNKITAITEPNGLGEFSITM